MKRNLLVTSSDSRNDHLKWVVITVELVLWFIFTETVTGRHTQTLANDIPTWICSPENRDENRTRENDSSWFTTINIISGKKANDEDLFLETNDSYDSKQIYFRILSNVNRIFFYGKNVETMRAIYSSRAFIIEPYRYVKD